MDSMVEFHQRQMGQPDPNPRIKCERCGDKYKWEEYWMERWAKKKMEPEFICDECKEKERKAWGFKKRLDNNRKIDEFVEDEEVSRGE